MNYRRSGGPAPGPEIAAIARSFERSLVAANKSPRTVESYIEAIDMLRRFLQERALPTRVGEITREHLQAFFEDVLATRRPATASNRYRSLKVFFGWLLEEDEIPHNPMHRMKAPAVPEAPPPVIPPESLRALLKATEGRDFYARRDTAIVRLLIDTGMRRSEIGNLRVEDVDLNRKTARVMGKGRRVRECPFGPKTAAALDRYLRVREGYPHSDAPDLWLGTKGPMGPWGIAYVIKDRCRQAGIPPIRPHLFRHTFAHEWLAEGGQEQDLMRLAGWRSREMLARYGASAADERAREAYRERAPGEKY